MGESQKATNNAAASDGTGAAGHAPQNGEYEISHFQPAAIFDAPQSQLMSQNPSGKQSEVDMVAGQSISHVKQGSAKNLELED